MDRHLRAAAFKWRVLSDRDPAAMAAIRSLHIALEPCVRRDARRAHGANVPAGPVAQCAAAQRLLSRRWHYGISAVFQSRANRGPAGERGRMSAAARWCAKQQRNGVFGE